MPIALIALVLLATLGGGCARARAEAHDDELKLDAYDGQIEAIDGSWLVELGVWWKRLGPIEASKKLLARTSVELFGKRLHLSAAAAAVDDDAMTMDLRAHW